VVSGVGCASFARALLDDSADIIYGFTFGRGEIDSPFDSEKIAARVATSWRQPIFLPYPGSWPASFSMGTPEARESLIPSISLSTLHSLIHR
jgi:hypothetical protein